MKPVRIPADIDREDPLLAGLAARQLAILATGSLLAWSVYSGLRATAPAALIAGLVAPILLGAAALALLRRDGVGLDRLLLAALRHAASPHRMVPAPDGVPAVPSWIDAPKTRLPAPLRLPLAAISDDGIIDLGSDGAAVICRASSLTFGLRTQAEQEALVAAFARFLDSLDAPVQIAVRAGLADLDGMATEIEGAAPTLPHPELERAAIEHARFLRRLGAGRDVLRRTVLIVLRHPSGSDARTPLLRRAEEATSALSSTGIGLAVLDGEAATAALIESMDPDEHRRAARSTPDGSPITGAAA